MNEFFKWLSANPVAANTLIVSFGSLVVAVILVFIIAFVQGREISLWPPKIGPGTDKAQKETGAKDAKSDSIFRSRTQLPDFADLLKNHDEIWIAGKDLFGLTDSYTGRILEAAKDKKRFRFLVVNPSEEHLIRTTIASSITHPTAKKRQDVIQIAIQHLKEIGQAAPDTIEVRLASFLPTCAYIILDGKEARGEMIIESYGYKISSSERLHVYLKRAIDKQIFDFHLRQFEEMWRCSDNLNLTG